jgi:hypothetical protein
VSVGREYVSVGIILVGACVVDPVMGTKMTGVITFAGSGVEGTGVEMKMSGSLVLRTWLVAICEVAVKLFSGVQVGRIFSKAGSLEVRMQRNPRLSVEIEGSAF